MKTLLKINDESSVKTFNGLLFICSEESNNPAMNNVQYVNEGELAARLFNMGYDEDTVSAVINGAKNDDEFEENEDETLDIDDGEPYVGDGPPLWIQSDIRKRLIEGGDYFKIAISYDLSTNESYLCTYDESDHFKEREINLLPITIYFKKIKGTIYLTIYEDNERKIYDIESLKYNPRYMNRLVDRISDILLYFNRVCEEAVETQDLTSILDIRRDLIVMREEEHCGNFK